MIRKLGFGLVIAMVGLMLGACEKTPRYAQQATMQYYHGDYAGAATTMAPACKEKNENYVLNHCRFGSAALAAGRLPDAENAFMAAQEVIQSTKTNSGEREATATIVWEGVKVWKGEPFERAMAFYYLGLTMLIKENPDYENARAAFQNSLFKLREYAKEKKDKNEFQQYKDFESNFALGYFGLGYCWLKRGEPGKADECFTQAIRINKDLSPVVQAVRNPATNVLLFVDAGRGPQRAGKGWYNEESAFGPTPAEAGPVPGLAVFANGKQVSPPIKYDMVDTLAMAQDQKWQDIDTIRKVKAALGTGMMAAGAGVAAYGADRHDTGTALAGLGLMIGGALVSASSQADVRYWEMLPRTVYVVPLALPPGSEQTITVRAGGWSSAPLKMLVKAPPADPRRGRPDQVLYFRMF